MATTFRLDPDREPWDRQPGEPAEEFDFWQHYSADGHRRSHTRTAEKFEVRHQVVARVARQNQWALRLAALRRWEKAQIAERVDQILDQALPAYTTAVGKLAMHAATTDLGNVPADRALAQVTAAFRTVMPEDERALVRLKPDVDGDSTLSQFDVGHTILSALDAHPEAKAAALDALRGADERRG